VKKLSLTLTIIICTFTVSALADTPVSTCFTQPGVWASFSSTWRGEGNLVQELHDYGLIFEDSKKSACAGYAATALKNKIYSTRTTAGFNRQHTFSDPGNLPGWIVGPYQNWLESSYVSLIFASALSIGGHGYLTQALDSELNYVSYYFDNNPVGLYGKGFPCGIQKPGGWLGATSDTCLEEHAIGAAAYGWLSAYQRKRFDANPDLAFYSMSCYYGGKAKDAINRALDVADSICVKDPQMIMDLNGRGPCNTTTLSAAVAALTRGSNAGTLYSLNRGQNITYGFGQLTAISSAVIGLEEGTQLPTDGSGAQRPDLLFTSDQKQIMKYQLYEAQLKSTSDGQFFKGHLPGSPAPTCIRFLSTGTPDTMLYQCTDNNHRPRWFPLLNAADGNAPATFFSRYLPGISGQSTVQDTGELTPRTPFAFNQFNTQNNGSYWVSGDFYLDDAGQPGNWGRRVWYGNFGYYWQNVSARDNFGLQPEPGEKRGRMSAIFDDQDPIGYLDAVSSSGVVSGWTCDKDDQWLSTGADVYIGGPKGSGTYAGRFVANVANEQAVTTMCGGGNYYQHRFSIQLPSWARGYYIYVYGEDATWRGETLLPLSSCSPPTCRWN